MVLVNSSEACRVAGTASWCRVNELIGGLVQADQGGGVASGDEASQIGECLAAGRLASGHV